MKKFNFKKKITLSFIISIFIVLALIGVDQLSKYLANTNVKLVNGEKIMVIKHIISFVLVHNTGAAWGMFGGSKIFLVTVSLLASIACLVIMYYVSDLKKSKVLSISMILITSGTIGNLIDRAFFADGVIDFLNFEFINFPVFNVADSCLTIGAVLLAIYFLFFYDNHPDYKKREKGSEDPSESKDEKTTAPEENKVVEESTINNSSNSEETEHVEG